MERHIRSKPGAGFQEIVPTGTMRFLDFARLRLAKGEQYSAATGPREYAVYFFSGRGSVSIETASGQRFTLTPAQARADVFSGPPAVVYIPPQARYTIAAESERLDAGIFSAPSQSAASPALVEGSSVVANEVGRGNWQRRVYSALAQNVPAERLLAGETLNPPGNWSSYPPHKHDHSHPPGEAVLEEIYFFRIKPEQGYGFIYTYTAPDDPDGFSNVFVIQDGDTVLLPKGYHPVVAAPGYELHYTWVLAGEERRYGAWADDPQHAWVKESA